MVRVKLRAELPVLAVGRLDLRFSFIFAEGFALANRTIPLPDAPETTAAAAAAPMSLAFSLPLAYTFVAQFSNEPSKPTELLLPEELLAVAELLAPPTLFALAFPKSC